MIDYAYSIISDIGCDLSSEMLTQLDVDCIPLKLLYDDRSLDIYADERQISVKDFYQSMRSGISPKTASSSPEQWLELARVDLQAGRDVIMVPFSSGLSGTYQTAVIAAEELRAQFSERTIRVPDVRCASMGLGLLLYHASNLRRQGADVNEAAVFLEQNALKICHWFTVEDLTYLRRGGRISKTAALAGTLMGIKPVMCMNDEGKLVGVGKRRGRNASLEALAEAAASNAITPEKQMFFISHGDCLDDAMKLETMIRERISIGGCMIHTIGPVIGSHSGPGTVAVFFLGEHR